MTVFKLFFLIYVFSLFFTKAVSQEIKIINEFKITKIGDTINHPWGMSLIDNKSVIVTSKKGLIYLINLDTYKFELIHKVDQTKDYNQGGLLDILSVKNNNLIEIFICFLNKSDNDLLISKYQLNNKKLLNKKIIFKSNYESKSGKHFGCRLVDYKKTILATLGDRGQRKNSQNPRNYPGSIIQLSYEGKKLGFKKNNWKSGIYSIGHRNPQGLIYIKEFDEVWSHEHGPKGGDEINIIKKGSNYGWPIVTFGKEYWGGPIGEGFSKRGMVDPIWKWVPSIAPSGIDFYKHDYFSKLKNTLLIGSLKFKSLYAVKLKNNKPTSEFVVFKNKIGRIRDVMIHPNGYILILNDEYEGGLYKLTKSLIN